MNGGASPLLVYGLTRNAEPHLAAALATLTAIEIALPGSIVLIGTNDNVDGTDRILHEWQKQSSAREVIRLDGLAAAIPDRIDRLAAVRNFCLQRVRQLSSPPFEFVLVLDLDGPNAGLNVADLVSVLSTWRPEWDGVFANQRRAYYDLYALRHSKWCPGDCLVEVESRVDFPFRTWKRARANAKFIYRRQHLIPKDSPPIEVDSAFGGLAIYRLKSLQGCWYGSRNIGGSVVCEHVVLHTQVRARGGRLFILPSLLNDAPGEHLGAQSGLKIPDNFLTLQTPSHGNVPPTS